MHPLIPYFQLSSFEVAGATVSLHGALLVAGCIVGAAVALFLGRRDRLPSAEFLIMYPGLFITLAIGSHLGSLLLYTPGWLREHPMAILDLWHGESSVGAIGLALVYVPAHLHVRRKTLAGHAVDGATARFADALAFGSLIGWLIGRLGCFVVHDSLGVQSNFWLAVYGICAGGPGSAACHDLGLYEAVVCLSCAAVVGLLRRGELAAGTVACIIGAYYGVSRFLLDFLRDPHADPRYFGLTPAQCGGVMLAALCVVAWLCGRATGTPRSGGMIVNRAPDERLRSFRR